MIVTSPTWWTLQARWRRWWRRKRAIYVVAFFAARLGGER